MRNKCFLGSESPASTSLCISISSKPTPGPQEPPAAQVWLYPTHPLCKLPLCATNGDVCFVAWAQSGKNLCWSGVVACVAWGGGTVKSWLLECANEHVSLPPLLNAGQPLKRAFLFFYIQMAATHCWLFLPSCFPITEKTWPILMVVYLY